MKVVKIFGSVAYFALKQLTYDSAECELYVFEIRCY